MTDDSVTIGITTPLSGPLAGPGTCTLAGLEAYFGAVNADGGVTFGDGLTRTVEVYVERAVLSRAVHWHAQDRVIRQGNQTIVL